jgi:Arc/MetJ family transcription regulator
MRTNVVLDDELLSQARRLTGVRTNREILRLALEELVRQRSKKDLAELAGRIRFRDDFDHKAAREVRRGDR